MIVRSWHVLCAPWGRSGSRSVHELCDHERLAAAPCLRQSNAGVTSRASRRQSGVMSEAAAMASSRRVRTPNRDRGCGDADVPVTPTVGAVPPGQPPGHRPIRMLGALRAVSVHEREIFQDTGCLGVAVPAAHADMFKRPRGVVSVAGAHCVRRQPSVSTSHLASPDARGAPRARNGPTDGSPCVSGA
jgi:hypothetical protein